MTKDIQPHEANSHAAKLFTHHMINSQEAVEYLRKRGMDGATAKRYHLGFAPRAQSGYSLTEHLSAYGSHYAAALEAGLIVLNENGKARDRFSDRIMFPIREPEGRIIGFGGRIMGKRDEKDTRPKYLNTQETPLFKKRNNLYGLYEAIEANGRTELDSLIVVEGYMDVVMLSRYGITNAVASLGTAITSEQIKLAFKYANHLTFCFDGDNAGIGAALKALSNSAPLIGPDKTVSFSFLPQGEDPDSMVRKKGAAETRHLLNANAQSFSEFLIDSARYSEPNPYSEEAATIARQYIAGLPVLTRLFHDTTKPHVDRERDLYRACILAEYNQALGMPAEFIHPEIRSIIRDFIKDDVWAASRNRTQHGASQMDNDRPEERRSIYVRKKGIDVNQNKRSPFKPPVIVGSNAPSRIQIAHIIADQHDDIISEAMNHPSWPEGFTLVDLPEWDNNHTPSDPGTYQGERDESIRALVDIAIRIHSEQESTNAKSRALDALLQIG